MTDNYRADVLDFITVLCKLARKRSTVRCHHMKNALKSFSSEIGKQFASDAYGVLKGAGSSLLKSAQIALEIGFKDYIDQNIERCRMVKTIINRLERVDLTEIYEDAYVSIGENSYSEDTVFGDEGPMRLIVTGTAGSGKSFLMRRTYLRLVETNTGRFPIFIELRNLNNLQSPDLLQHAISFLEPHVTSMTDSLAHKLFKSGKIALLLDGFDELYSRIKDNVGHQIRDISYKYPNCRIVVSGRPDDTFTSWHSFDEYQILPFRKEQCLSLISKAIFPDDLKLRFIDSVGDTLFDSHREYLSNPLMTYVMLMTADQFSEFPSEMSSFYAKAFETLYSGHDLVKSGDYRREVKSTLKLRELDRILEYFCAMSYVDGVYQYSDDIASKYLKNALEITRISANVDDLMFDLSRSYCLLIIDGKNYSYIHRTFQEYFAAKCVTFSERIDYLEYNSKIVDRRSESESYIKLIMEVGPEKLEERYLLPTLRSFISEMTSIARRQPKRFMSSFMSGYGITEGGEVRVLYHGVPLKNRWYGFALTFLSAYDPENFSEQAFTVMEDESYIRSYSKVKFVDEQAGLDHYHVDISRCSNAFLKKTNMYLMLLKIYKSAISLLEAKSKKIEIDKKSVVVSLSSGRLRRR